MPDQNCTCDEPVEDSIHFFLECPLDTEQRQVYIDTFPDTGENKITVIIFSSSIQYTNSNITN